MSSTYERVCRGCGASEENARLERCPICAKLFCPDCAYKAAGRRFCSGGCSRTYSYGDTEENDDEDIDYDD